MDPADFESLLDDYVAAVFVMSPVRATSLGVAGHDHLLSDRSEAGIREERAALDAWAARIAAVEPAALTPDQRIDRDLVLTSLRHRQLVRERDGYKRSPTLYVNEGLAGVSTLFVNRPGPDEELVAAATARMRAIPTVLANGAQQLDAAVASPLACERGARLAASARDYFRHRLPLEVDHADLAGQLATEGEVVARAYDRFHDDMTRLAADATGDWRYGNALYSAVLTECELLPFDAAELLERGRAAYEQARAELDAARRDVGASARRHLASLEPLASVQDRLSYLQDRVDAARDFCADHHLVTLPADEICVVRAMPAHHRAVSAVAGYRQAPPLAADLEPPAAGALLVPGPRRRRDGRVWNGRAAGSDSMVTHEAYPGHHVHLSRARQHRRPVRHLHGSSFLREGWGLYSEKLMHDHGFFSDPVEHLAHLRSVCFRAARIVLDVGLHTGALDPAAAVAFMRSELRSTAETARLEVERYCSNPIQAVSYYAGCLAVEEMRDRYVARPGASLLDFHDRLTAAGSLPLELADRSLYGADERTATGTRSAYLAASGPAIAVKST
jgi:uncharacterized protein (DUF885 family)